MKDTHRVKALLKIAVLNEEFSPVFQEEKKGSCHLVQSASSLYSHQCMQHESDIHAQTRIKRYFQPLFLGVQ
jgi:hypothetical protein